MSRTTDGETAAPSVSEGAVLVKSEPIAAGTPIVKGYDFNRGVDYEVLLDSYGTSGFQATNFGLAVAELNKMISTKIEKFTPADSGSVAFDAPSKRPITGCTIFLGYTSNMVSSGLRETLRFLAEHNLIDCLVTSAGGVEEDLIKCLAPTYVASFFLQGAELRRRGHNRIGNLLVPNDNYCKFEDWLMPRLDAMLTAQRDQSVSWTPSKMIQFLGEQIGSEDSICYWAAKKEIPIFCPGLTDGSIGDMLYFHSYRNPGLKLDVVEDVRRLNSMAVKSAKTGMIILGGGLIKHHICNANLMRNGADFAVYVNTGQVSVDLA